MMNGFLILTLLAADPVQASDPIVVTASREPERQAEAPVSSTLFDAATLEALSLPQASDVLRLTPGVSVAVSGPKGSLTEVRIRGAEANHTLLFVDGIRFNDPAAGNAARFELLSSDALSRIEVVRGPQSALWGSEALGGVVAVDGADARRGTGLSALGEYGALRSGRGFVQGAAEAGAVALSAAAGAMGSAGIDELGRPGGERDGYWTRFATAKAVARPASGIEIGVVGHVVEGKSEFDGYDPVTFQRAETLDNTRNRIAAGRGWASYQADGWHLSADVSLLGSSNRNFTGAAPLNRTGGERLTAGAQVSKTLGRHRVTAAFEHESERFHARDRQYFGATDQDRSRRLDALVGEWRADWAAFLATDVAVRHDRFSAFKDATTLRAAAIVSPGAGWTLHAGYGEGIAQPTFYDLYGFFPGAFRGNPSLRPERSRSAELGVAWGGRSFSASLTGFTARLEDEILDVFDPVTFLSSTANASGRSRRRGIEAALEFRPARALRLAANYTYLDADEQKAAGTALVREVRRPRHSANLVAAWTGGRLSASGTAAYVGARNDVNFDVFPAQTVRLHPYVLASARLGYRLTKQVELYVRAENAFDARYQDAVGYATAGRTVYAGLRLRLGD
ncbi:MAG: TonB-dependent receptor [Alphaproteobacteria bacterium]|nr:TonB-dependent receptor [Alphaproteobacteria bacterium]